jgi:hypothetical protein
MKARCYELIYIRSVCGIIPTGEHRNVRRKTYPSATFLTINLVRSTVVTFYCISIRICFNVIWLSTPGSSFWFSNHTFYVYFRFPIYATCPFHRNLLDLDPQSANCDDPLHTRSCVLLFPCALVLSLSVYSSAPVSTGNTFQDLTRLRETADNTERYV